MEVDENRVPNGTVNGTSGTSLSKEAFLMEFEGPTKLYRLLHNRSQEEPLFLNRNLQYEKRRKAKFAADPKKGLMNQIADKLKLTAIPVRTCDSMRMSLNGIFGVHESDNSDVKKNFVPVKIKFIGTNPSKRKPEPDQVHKETETILVLNPKKNEVSEGLQLDLTDIENTSTIIFECQFPEPTVEEAQPRKRLRLNGEDAKKKQFPKLFGKCVATLNLKSPITEGKYEIVLDEEAKVKSATPRKSNWQTFGSGEPSQILETSSSYVPKIRFSLAWTEAMSHIRSSLARLTKASLPYEDIKVNYQLYYQSRSRVCSEMFTSPTCQFCLKKLHRVKHLLLHLKASHDKFLFQTPEQKAIDGNVQLDTIHIEVYPNAKYKRSYLGNPSLRKKESTKVIVWKGKLVDKDALNDESFDMDKSEVSLQTFGHNRLYFHTSYNLPIRACEFEYDSEDDSTSEFRWIREHMADQINEFTDVNEDEKLIMKLWNHHLMCRKVLSLQQITEAAKEISSKYAHFIKSRNVRRNWLLHLLNLVDHNLLRPSEVPKIMQILDETEGDPEDIPDITGDLAEKKALEDIIAQADTIRLAH